MNKKCRGKYPLKLLFLWISKFSIEFRDNWTAILGFRKIQTVTEVHIDVQSDF